MSVNVVNLFPKRYQNSDDQQNEKILPKYHEIAFIHSFPTMYIEGGSTFGRSQSKRGFSPKKQSCKMSKDLHRSNLSNQILPQESA